ncbi:GGDEF domain-containing protein [Acinetobacter sp. 187]|uniref:GGDEF domain-containing protein n=1 Tax=Acinetobacter lanii TaxID=2715163 RepID=UPI00140B78E8|nr:GGDEF domain-containing protein [Acinetobacter lanii]NHC02479.1 GGDEF domain-containing protein [Acinetobacter lanii]
MNTEIDVNDLQAQKQQFSELLILQQNRVLSVFTESLEHEFWREREKRFIALILRVFVPGSIIFFITQMISMTSNYFHTEPEFRNHDIVLMGCSSMAGWLGFLAFYLLSKNENWNLKFKVVAPIILCVTLSVVQISVLMSHSISMTWRGTLIILLSQMLAYLCTGSRPKYTFIAGMLSIAVTCVGLKLLGGHLSFWILSNVLLLGNLMGLALSFMTVSTERLHFIQEMIIGIDKQIHEILTSHFAKLSNQDTLTLLGNRRSFNEELSRIYNDAIATSHSFALIFIDVDYFKLYNDTYGHQEGDFVLVRVAQTLLRHIGEKDSAIRYGGEEFIILLNHTSYDEAAQVAEDILQDIRDQNIPHCASKIHDYLTVSIGLSLFSGEEGIAESGLLKLADDALYQAKNNGRDQKVIFTPDLNQSQD